MPQLDPFTFSSQVFWLITIFLAGYFFFFNFLVPNVYSSLKARNSHFVRLHGKLLAYGLKKGTVEKEYRNRLSSILTSNSALLDRFSAQTDELNSSLYTSISSSLDFNDLQADSLELMTYYSALEASDKEKKD